MKYKIKLSTVTTYKFGGYCDNFYKISNNDINLFDEAFSNKENFILGKGSNIAFSDKDYEGNVINPNFNDISFIKNSGEVKVGASFFLPDLARFYKDKNLINAEFLIGDCPVDERSSSLQCGFGKNLTSKTKSASLGEPFLNPNEVTEIFKS